MEASQVPINKQLNKHDSAIKKNKILSFATICMDLQGTVVGEVRGKRTPYNFTYKWNLQNKINKQNENSS